MKPISVILVLLIIGGALFGSTTGATATTPTPASKIKALAWPIAPATDKQIEEARVCDMHGMVDELYPESVSVDKLSSKPAPTTACGWAALAFAYSKRAGDNRPADAGIAAFQKAISLNSALAFTLPMLSGYFGIDGLVDAPPFAKQPVVRVEASHEFSGLGERVEFSYVITSGDNKPQVTGKSGVDKITKISGSVDKALVQALGPALTDFFPMRAQFSQIVCSDDYPDWTVTLTFKDGTTIKLVTNRSNIYFSGGPWQTEIKQQNYMQYSGAFLVAMLNISEALNLPKDETAAMSCGGADDPLPLAFPTAEPTESK